MKLLVTGGLGFIGSNFILKILNEYKDFSIINVDAEFFGSNKKNLEHVKSSSNYQYVKGNITNQNLMQNLRHAIRDGRLETFAGEFSGTAKIGDIDPL